MDPRYSYYNNLYFTRYDNNKYRIHLQRKNNTNYYSQPMIKYQNNQ